MAQVNVAALRTKALSMISEAETLEARSRRHAEDRLAELQSIWRAEVLPKLTLVLHTALNRLEKFGEEISGQELTTLLAEAELESRRGWPQKLEQFFFPEWVRQTTPETVLSLKETKAGVRESQEAVRLRERGAALLGLLEPVTSEEVTTSWLDRCGFKGTWTEL